MVTTEEALSTGTTPQAHRPKESVFKIILQALRATIVLALLTGIVFPMAITGIGQVIFPKQANGSIITNSAGQPVGSALLAQKFEGEKYFHSRPSAAGSGYAGEASGGTNLGPTSQKLFEGQPDDPKTKDVNESFDGVKQLTDAYRKENNLQKNFLVPIDAVTRSGSGLDPDISTENAAVQATRVARARKVPLQTIMSKIVQCTEGRQFGCLGEPRVNVLMLNLELDKSAK
jgi:potassium-transporting ATPase KdpC subunit